MQRNACEGEVVRTVMVRCRRSMEEAAARVFMARSNCAGVKVGTTAAAPSGLGSKSVSTPLLDTSVHLSTCHTRPLSQQSCSLSVTL